MVMTLENELYKFFDDDSEIRNPDMNIARLVDDCMYGLNKREKLKYTLTRSIKFGKKVADNSLKFAGYIPGSKIICKGAKRTASYTGNLIKSLVKKEVKKLLAR